MILELARPPPPKRKGEDADPLVALEKKLEAKIEAKFDSFMAQIMGAISQTQSQIQALTGEVQKQRAELVAIGERQQKAEEKFDPLQTDQRRTK